MFTRTRPIPGPKHLRFAAISTLLGVLTLLSAGITGATEITVFTDRSIVLTSAADATVVHLDTAREIEARLAADLPADLPADPGRAQAIVQQRLKQGGGQLQRDLASAYQGVAEAWGLSISTLPAVVVDRRYVIYGEPDVANAAARIEAYRRAQP